MNPLLLRLLRIRDDLLRAAVPENQMRQRRRRGEAENWLFKCMLLRRVDIPTEEANAISRIV